MTPPWRRRSHGPHPTRESFGPSFVSNKYVSSDSAPLMPACRRQNRPPWVRFATVPTTYPENPGLPSRSWYSCDACDRMASVRAARQQNLHDRRAEGRKLDGEAVLVSRILRLDNVAPFHAILQWDSAGPSLLSSNRTALPRPFLSSDGIARPNRTTLPRSALFSDGTERARPLLSSDRIARPHPLLSSDGIALHTRTCSLRANRRNQRRWKQVPTYIL